MNVVFIPILEIRKVTNRVCTEIFCPNPLLFPPNEILSLQNLWFWNEGYLNVSGTLSSFDFTLFLFLFFLGFHFYDIICEIWRVKETNLLVYVYVCREKGTETNTDWHRKTQTYRHREIRFCFPMFVTIPVLLAN